MSGPALPDLDRAVRLIGRLDMKAPGCGAIYHAWEYANRLRGADYDEMRDDWEALRRLVDRAVAKRDEARAAADLR